MQIRLEAISLNSLVLQFTIYTNPLASDDKVATAIILEV